MTAADFVKSINNETTSDIESTYFSENGVDKAISIEFEIHFPFLHSSTRFVCDIYYKLDTKLNKYMGIEIKMYESDAVGEMENINIEGEASINMDLSSLLNLALPYRDKIQAYHDKSDLDDFSSYFVDYDNGDVELEIVNSSLKLSEYGSMSIRESNKNKIYIDLYVNMNKNKINKMLDSNKLTTIDLENVNVKEFANNLIKFDKELQEHLTNTVKNSINKKVEQLLDSFIKLIESF